MKICSKCKKIKQIQQFGKCSRNKDGLMSECKSCHNKYKISYKQQNPEITQKSNSNFYKNHKEVVLSCNKQWRENNPEAYKESVKKSNSKNKSKKSEYNRQYREKNRETLNSNTRKWYANNRIEVIKKKTKYTKNRIKTDINFRLSRSLRDRLNKALKNNQKNGSAVKDLGCSIEEFKNHIEAKFYIGMNWSNYGFGYGKWQLDHIKPLFSFDLTKREQLLEACNFINIQPLWYEDHTRKTAKDIKQVRND